MNAKDRDVDDSTANQSDDGGGDDDGGDSRLDEESEAEHEVAKPSVPITKRMDRVRASVQSANIQPGQSDFSTKWAIDRLDEREKRFAFAAAGGSALFGVLINLSQTHNHNFVRAKGQLTPQTILILGLVAAGLLVATTILGRRAPVGFVAMFSGAIFGGAFLFLGLPFFALAAWLLFRSYKIQRDTAANVRAARSAASSGSSPSPRQATAGRPPAVARKARRTSGPPGPTANKRYTPKRPPPPPLPPPKLTRRQRKAAESSD